MSDEVQVPRTLETPPRSTGNAHADFPLILDWMWKAYQVISQSVNYIKAQATSPDVNIEDLPDPATATISSAQVTANQAYALANDQKGRIDNFISGTVTVSDTDDNGSVSFSSTQGNSDYRIILQAKSVTGAPAAASLAIKTKTYTEAGFSFTLGSAPGAGTSVTFEWQLIRND